MTDRFKESLVASDQTVINKIEFLQNGEVVYTIEGRAVVDPETRNEVELLDGQIDVHKTDINRSGTIKLADLSDDLALNDAKDLLVPIQSEIRLYRGLLYSDRTMNDEEGEGFDREYVPIGTLVVQQATFDWPSVDIIGYDRMYLAQLQTDIVPYTIKSGILIVDALKDLLHKKIPQGRLFINFPSFDHIAGVTVIKPEGSDPAKLAHDLATLCGHMLFADPMGVFRMIPEPTVDGDPIDFYPSPYEEGPGSIILPWPSEVVSGENAKNVVAVMGVTQGTAPQVLARIENLNPLSSMSTRNLKMFIPEIIEASALYDTAVKANSYAKTKLTKLGLSDVIAFSAVVNPGLYSGDILSVKTTHPDNLSANLIVDDFSIPLRGAGPQQLTCRANVEPFLQ
jgi:hypothetical protein